MGRDTKLQGWTRPAIRLLLPLTVAFLLIRLEPWLTRLAGSRPGVLPVAMTALLGGLLLSSVRRWLIVTLCFGISLLALRDTFRIIPLPASIDYAFVEALYPIGWALLAILAAVAAAGEAIHPGSVWARRCYFASAALYLSGHGLIIFLRAPNWEALILMVTGVVALVGAVLAHRVVAAEGSPENEPEDLRVLAEKDARRAERLAAREWREQPEEMSKAR